VKTTNAFSYENVKNKVGENMGEKQDLEKVSVPNKSSLPGANVKRLFNAILQMGPII